MSIIHEDKFKPKCTGYQEMCDMKTQKQKTPQKQFCDWIYFWNLLHFTTQAIAHIMSCHVMSYPFHILAVLDPIYMYNINIFHPPLRV